MTQRSKRVRDDTFVSVRRRSGRHEHQAAAVIARSAVGELQHIRRDHIRFTQREDVSHTQLS
jgi:hypothetical protein